MLKSAQTLEQQAGTVPVHGEAAQLPQWFMSEAKSVQFPEQHTGLGELHLKQFNVSIASKNIRHARHLKADLLPVPVNDKGALETKAKLPSDECTISESKPVAHEVIGQVIVDNLLYYCKFHSS